MNGGSCESGLGLAYPTFTVELVGHTEAGRKSSADDYGDWELSADRAGASRRKLLQHGVAASQVHRVSGVGDTQPMENTKPADETNRRVSVLLKIQEGSRVPENAIESSTPPNTANTL